MTHVVKSGFLRRYSRKFMNDGWKNVWVVLYSDSTLAWFKTQTDTVRKGQANMKAIANFFAVGQYTRNVPGLPAIPSGTKLDHVMAIPEAARRDARVEFLMASSDQDLAEWTKAIASTVSPPSSQSAQGPSAYAQAHAPAPQYAQSSGIPHAGYSQPQYGSYPQQQPAYPQQQPAYPQQQPAYPQQMYVQAQPVPLAQPYMVQSAASYGYPQAYQPAVYNVATHPQTVVIRDHCHSDGLVVGGGAGLVGGMAAGYMMGSMMGHHHDHYGGMGIGLGHGYGSWSSLSSFGSFD